MKYILIIHIIMVLVVGFCSCKIEKPKNRVNIHQINDDGSSNYRKILEERLKQDKESHYYNTKKKENFK